VALTGEIINIEDVYEAEGFDFTGPRKYDKQSGYRSRSMLVIPMKNHENDIIGVVQLLNALDPDTGVQIPFYDSYVDAVGSLASQAAIALTNAQLIQELKDLFDAFIQSIATAIDEKSPYTGGHIRRVVELTMMIAERINESHTGALKDLHFSEDEMEELRLATWMHDVGKITTPEYVVDKATKLHTIFDRIELLETRFQLIASRLETECLSKKLALMEKGEASKKELEAIDAAYAEKFKAVGAEFAELEEYNIPGEFMNQEKLKRVEKISQKTYTMDGGEFPYLTDDEKKNLSVPKGSLTDEERKIIQNHVVMTWKILYHLPFPKHLANVPDYAGAHHEKMDGSGYPLGLRGEDLAPQARIMAVADIFEALTAKDRPYKEPMKLSKAIQILGYMKKDGEIDPDIYDLFVGSGLALQYANKEMNPTQIDIPENTESE